MNTESREYPWLLQELAATARRKVSGINNLVHTPEDTLIIKCPTGVFSMSLTPHGENNQWVNIEAEGLTLLNAEFDGFVQDALKPPKALSKSDKWHWYFEKYPADIDDATRVRFELIMQVKDLDVWFNTLIEKLTQIPLEQMR